MENLLDQKVTHITKGEGWEIEPVAGDGMTIREVVSLPLQHTQARQGRWAGSLYGYIHSFFINGDLENGRYDAYNDSVMLDKLLKEEQNRCG